MGDAGEFDFSAALPKPIEFVFSEDVFEHIPSESLVRLLANLKRCMSADGVAVFRPNVFTGITGGHLTEWYGSAVEQRDPRTTVRSEPWEHLRKKRFVANTYLNKLRLGEYREMISKEFEIREESRENPTLGQTIPYARVAGGTSGLFRGRVA